MNTNYTALYPGLEVEGHAIEFDEARALEKLQNDDVIAIDTETSGFSPWKNQIATVQLYGEKTGTLAFFHPRGQLSDNLKRFLNQHPALWVAHNGVNFDNVFLKTHGVNTFAWTVYDTLVAEAVLAISGRKGVSKKLADTIQRRLNAKIKQQYPASGSWMDDVLPPDKITYSLADVVALPGVRLAQMEKAREQRQERGLALEMELVPIVSEMRYNGFPVGLDTFRRFQHDNVVQRNAAFHEICRVHGLPEIDFEAFEVMKEKEKKAWFNPRSTQQVKSWFLQNGFALESTDMEHMARLWLDGGAGADLADLMLRFRLPDQMMKMYPEGFLEEVVEPDGAIHNSWWQVGAVTGRFSASDPNSQQYSKLMRYVFEAKPGRAIVDIDYSQIEVYCAAYICQDENLLQAVHAGEDLHRAIAAVMYDLEADPSQVTKDQRRKAKNTTFGMLFGGSAATLYATAVKNSVRGGTRSKDVMDLKTARELERAFYARFTGIAAKMNKADGMARRPGPVFMNMPTGLRRMLVGADKKKTVIMNTAIQGTAAAGLKYALLEAKHAGLTKYVCGPVHDEIVSHVPCDEAQDFAVEMRRCMVTGMNAVLPGLPIRTETSIGSYWGANDFAAELERV